MQLINQSRTTKSDFEPGGYREDYGTIIAEPAVAEKGYFDTKLEVRFNFNSTTSTKLLIGQKPWWSFQRPTETHGE